MSRPKATGQNPTHDITLSDGSTRWGFMLANGPRSLQETPMTPSTLLINRQGSKYGDFDPSMAHVEQRTWMGGRGGDDFSQDNSRYYDSQALWTMVEEHAFPSMQWAFPTGYRSEDRNLPGSVAWRGCFGSYRYIAVKFTASATYNADKIHLWIRRIGTPGTLTAELWSDSAGSPDAVLKTATVTTTTVTDVISVFAKFDFTGTQALSSGTDYWVVVYGASTDSAASHWEIGVDDATSSGKYGAAGSSWTDTNFKLYYRVTDADVARKWRFFIYGGILYAVDRKDDNITASQIYSISNNAMTEITTTGLGVVTDVCISNDVVYFAQGETDPIRRMNYASSTYTWDDDATNYATFIYSYYDVADGPQVCRVNSSATAVTFSRANALTWAQYTGPVTGLTFKTGINIGDASAAATGMVDYNDEIYVTKQDSIWAVKNDRLSKLNVSIGDAPGPENGAALKPFNLFLMISYQHTLLRLYGGTLDDIGPWHGMGIPNGRSGSIAALESVMSYLFAAIDAGELGTSSIMCYDGIAWHEMMRSFEVGKRIRGLKWMPSTSTNPRLWADCGGDVVYMLFPRNTFMPIIDTSVNYQHESVLVTSTFDMGYAQLPKLFKEINLITKNIDTDVRVYVDYQVDDAIGSNNWIYLSDVVESPAEAVLVNRGNVKAIRFRFRLVTEDVSIPPIIKATVLEGVARTPVKYQWTLRCRVSTLQTNKQGVAEKKPEKILAWLKEKAGNAEVIYMRTVYPGLMEKVVLIEPPTPWREFENSVLKIWGGQIVFTVREA